MGERGPGLRRRVAQTAGGGSCRVVTGYVRPAHCRPPTVSAPFLLCPALSPPLSAVSDDPNDDTLSYAIAYGNDAGYFTISNSTGALSVVVPLDYLAVQSFTLLVMISKARLPSFQTGCTVFITGAAYFEVSSHPPPPPPS